MIYDIIRLTNIIHPNTKDGAIHIIFSGDGTCMIKKTPLKGYSKPLFMAESPSELLKYLVAAHNKKIQRELLPFGGGDVESDE